ncbi:hypothetical protein KBC40_00645 [Patescibacteria group bacterium]|nr:hypothetical protein [Patescibacteria group bacterium]
MANKTDAQFEQPSQLLLLANKYLGAILGVLILVVFVLGYLLVLSPGIKKFTEAKASVTEVSAAEKDVNALIAQVSDLETKFQKAKTERTNALLRLQKIVPENPEIAELFVLAERLALNRGFILQNVDFSTEGDDQATKKAVAGEEGEAVIPSSALETVSINMTVSQIPPEEATGDDEEVASAIIPNPYDLFKQYLDDLERNVRLMDVESLSFSGSGESLMMTFTMKTYFVNK